MKSRLLVCNTYSQLIEAIQLRITIFKNDNVSVIITDHSNNSESVCDKVKQIGVFENVYYIKTLKEYKAPDKFTSKIARLIDYVFGKDNAWKNTISETIDELIYYSQTDEVYTLFAFLYEKNKNIELSRYEEGIVSYDDWNFNSKKAEIATKIRHNIGKKALEDKVTRFYCFYPELYKGKLKPVRIPTIDSESSITTILREIFNVNSSRTNYSQYKYIYFASIYDIEHGKPIGELETILDIAKTVGMDNLLVKVHPRDNPIRFKQHGLHVDELSSVPWEAIQLGNDFSKHVFLTANSCSVLSVSLIQKNKPKILYVYPLCRIDDNPVAADTVKIIKDLLNSEFGKKYITSARVVHSVEQIKKYGIMG